MKKIICQACRETDPKAFDYTHHGLSAAIHHLVVTHEFNISVAMAVILEVITQRGEPVS